MRTSPTLSWRIGIATVALPALVLGSSTMAAAQATAPMMPPMASENDPSLLPSGAMPLPPSAEAFRNRFDLALHEHTYLAGDTTNALVNGRREEYLAAQSALNANTVELARTMGALYGPANEATFFAGWKRHIQDYELYAQGAVAGSDTQKQQARADLDAYVAESQAFFAQLNPAAPTDKLGAALTDHVHGTLDVIDAQAAKDVTRAFTLGRAGAMMTATQLADPLAVAILAQFPTRFAGDSNTPDASMRRQMSLMVQADVFLGGAALSALEQGRRPEADAISGVLEHNTSDLASMVGPVLGPDNQSRFVDLWHARTSALTDYAAAAAANDVNARQQSVQRLDTCRAGIDALFSRGASLPSGASVGDRFVPQAAYVTASLDALAAHDIGSAKAFAGGAAKQSEEIAVRMVSQLQAAAQQNGATGG